MSWIKGIIFGAVGFIIGDGLIVLLTGVDFDSDLAVFIGYLFFFIGWLLGAGVWDHWARGWFGFENKPTPTMESHGWKRYFNFSVDHKVIGVQYLVTFMILFLLAGLFAMVFRYELMRPGLDLLEPKAYNTFMSTHGIFMIAVAVTSIIGAFGNYVMPMQIGADDMAFPRLNALSYWTTPPVALLILFANLLPFTSVDYGFDFGWTAYPPLSTAIGLGKLFMLMGFFTLGFSSILGGLNVIVTVIRLRAPGMTWGRLPIFTWGVFSTSILSLIFTQFVAVAMLMVIADRAFGTAFFAPDQGGGALLYEHIFWIYSHPAVYVMIIPGLAIMLEIIPHFSRKPLFGYKWAVGGFFGIVGLSATVWAHHMFTSGMADWLTVPFMAATEFISIPTGLVFLAALGTLWAGRLRLKTPMLFAMSVLFNFLIGGLTGIFNADVAVDLQLHDTYWVVAHFHYTIVGGEIFALFAGIYYWYPKITGRMYNERLGKLHFWWMWIGFQAVFLPMFWLGYNGMNRRISDYIPELGSVNMFVSLAAFALGASFLVFVYNFVVSWARGKQAVDNPWEARTLEWQTSSPPIEHNFHATPEVTGHPYDYGVPDSPHAVLGEAHPAVAD
ncbi:MAG: cytochrome c oxidase subunit I [Chloroflexi bacterium]|nr:MAG: cytochrome c oxidase subunit I [Chloroflexota bacterium]